MPVLQSCPPLCTTVPSYTNGLVTKRWFSPPGGGVSRKGWLATVCNLKGE